MHTYDTLEIKKGQHLHFTERFFIEKMIALGKSNRSIGRLLDRPHSTINNEVKRGTIKQMRIVNGKREYYYEYCAYAAEQQMADVGAMATFSLNTDFENFSVFKPNDYHKPTVDKMLDQLLNWTRTLKSIR